MRLRTSLTLLAAAGLVAGAAAAPAAAATTPKKPKDKVTVHWQALHPHWGTFDHFSGTAPSWAKKVAVQRLAGSTWKTFYTDPVIDGKFSDSIVFISSLQSTNRILALGTAGHKGVASKPVMLTAIAPTQLATLTGDGPMVSAPIAVRDFVAVDVKWTCAGEPNGHAIAVEVVQDGYVVGNVTDGKTTSGEDANIVETDSYASSVEIVGATDCHWEMTVTG